MTAPVDEVCTDDAMRTWSGCHGLLWVCGFVGLWACGCETHVIELSAQFAALVLIHCLIARQLVEVSVTPERDDNTEACAGICSTAVSSALGEWLKVSTGAL